MTRSSAENKFGPREGFGYIVSQVVDMTKGTLMAAILSVSAVVFAVPAAGEIISQVGAPPASLATWDLEVNLTPWGYIEFAQVPPSALSQGSTFAEATDLGWASEPSAQSSQADSDTQPGSGAEDNTPPKIELKTKIPCKRDWDCRKLDRFVKLKHPICIGPERVFDGRTDPLLTKRPYVLLDLIGKVYTEYLQIGYTVHYRCGPEGFCEVGKLGLYGDENVECKYGCLVTPVKKNGKTYSNFCLCLPGQKRNKPVFCDPKRGRHVYYIYVDWTCEESVMIAGYCPIGAECQIVNERTGRWYCKPLEGKLPSQGATSESSGVQYVLLIPSNLETTSIAVAAIKNGRIIAEKPISNMSAMEYINKYGPVDAGMAYEFALKTGLVAEVAYARADEGATTPTSDSVLGGISKDIHAALNTSQAYTAIIF